MKNGNVTGQFSKLNGNIIISYNEVFSLVLMVEYIYHINFMYN